MYENVINGFQEKFFVFHRHKFEKRVEYLIANGKNLVHVFYWIPIVCEDLTTEVGQSPEGIALHNNKVQHARHNHRKKWEIRSLQY